ncbi:MAG: PqqD family protein [Gemmatimonadaceae bacterium]
MLPTPRKDVIFKRLRDGAVVYHCADEIYFGLNAEGARLWELLPPTSTTLDEVVDRMVAEHPEMDPAIIREDAEELFESLEKFGLITTLPARAA